MRKRPMLALFLALLLVTAVAVPATAQETTTSQVTFSIGAPVFSFTPENVSLGEIDYNTSHAVWSSMQLQVYITGTLQSATVYATGTLPAGWTLIGREPTDNDSDTVGVTFVEWDQSTGQEIKYDISADSTAPTDVTAAVRDGQTGIQVGLGPRQNGATGSAYITLHWTVTGA